MLNTNLKTFSTKFNMASAVLKQILLVEKFKFYRVLFLLSFYKGDQNIKIIAFLIFIRLDKLTKYLP